MDAAPTDCQARGPPGLAGDVFRREAAYNGNAAGVIQTLVVEELAP
jgi:hypothetical protein